jgi:hypothetical protein
MSKWTNVQGFYFDIIFNTREVIEILIQTIQLYRMTFLVSRKWISSLNVAIIFINCWSTPLIMKYVGNFSNDKPKKALGRFICILVDTLLDFSSCILIPFMVLVPYYQQKEQITSMQLDALYEATFMVNLAVELRLILSNSWIALLPVVLPAMSMNFCMENMKQLIIHQDTSTTTSTMIVFVSPIIAEEEEKEKQVNVEKKKEKLVDVHPYIAAVSHHSPPSRPQVKKTTRSQKYKKTIRFLSKSSISFKERYGKRIKEYFSFLHTFFLLLGMGIVMTHLFAINQPTMEGCQETVYPWFESRMSCSVLYINCVERQIKGKSDELELIFENSSEKSISALVFMHCPLFEMPTKITTFSNLFWMEIYNSTLEKWPKEAALRSHLHPIMTSLYMVHVNFTNDFPSGLLVDEMPPNLVNFQVAHSNLKTLPTELHTKWSSQMLHFYIEWSELTEVPATLASMNFVILSLVGNQIQTIPTSILAQPTDKLFFSYNPIKNFSNDDSIELREENNIQRELHLEYTNLMTLPFWLDGAIEKDQLKVFAFASPLCNNNNTTNDEHTRLQMCLQPKDPTKINQFPSQTYIASKKTTP